ncbi:MAG: family 78 glycoside hydrolase catalytic domain [Armatimonadota bacterium]|nr:family 78 glycoside hydrolase catalytic domain [bacterium]
MDWQAKWIWAKSHSRTPDLYMYARKEFSVKSASSATIRLTCSSEYKLYVNGRYVGSGPGPCLPAYQYFDSYDLKRYIRPGGNVIGVLCHNYGVDTRNRPETPGGLLVEAEIVCAGGKRLDIISDDTWRVMPAPEWSSNSMRICWSAGFQEIYDSRKKPVGWNVVGFDDSNWQFPEILGDTGIEPWTNLVPREIAHLREWEVFAESVLESGTVTRLDDPHLDIATCMYKESTHAKPGSVKNERNLLSGRRGFAEIERWPDTYLVIDFGRQVVGFPAIKIADGGCGRIDIGYGATLDANGRVETTECGILQADRLILHGGRQEWQPFGRRAFRYIQLTFRDLERPVLLECVSAQCIGYPVEQVSSFECSDELLNEIWRAGVYTLSTSMQDDYEDGVFCEHSDNMRLHALANYYCFNDSALAAKSLRRFCPQCASPERKMNWIIALHDYYLHTGDGDLVEQLYSNVRLILDGRPETSDDCESAEHQALYYQALRDASKLAAALHNNDDTIRWHAESVYASKSLADDIVPCDALDAIRRGHAGESSCIAAVYFLQSEILGVKPSMPESDVVVIHPRVADMQWARGKLAMGKRCVEVEWSVGPGHFQIDINAPGGYIVALPTGLFDDPIIEEFDLSPETPERRARKTYGWGNVIWRSSEERDPYLDWLETQEAEPPEYYKPKTRCSREGEYLWVREGSYTHVRYDIREACDTH